MGLQGLRVPIVGLAVASGLSVVTALIGTASSGDGGVQGLARFARIDPSLYQSDGQNSSFTPASLSDQPVSVVMEMAGAPVAAHDADARKQGRGLTDDEKHAIRQQLESQQNALDGDLAAAQARVVGKMQDAYNGIHVVVPQRNLSQLASMPGVVAVHGVQAFTPDNVNAIPFIGAQDAWGGFRLTGKGVRVAVIDTGIDYTHADFGGPGTVAAWNAAKATSTQPADPTMFGPNAPKVKGGYDFVGDAYDARIPGSVPVPDPNPLDCFGHGTHTAGTLAGFGVTSDGKTYAGSYNATTIAIHNWNVGPGVAPQADIYAYRVFGCAGSSEVVDLAINRAVADGVDVISMSLGSPLGGTTDPTSVAAQRAFEDGITVVASAGNQGSGAYVVGAPGTANGVLSVAAIEGVQKYPGATLALSTGTMVTTIDANGAVLPGANLPIKVLHNSTGGVSLGCNPAEYVAAGVAGALVVTKRGSCARVARAIYGQQAGAAAVLMINTASGYPPFEGDITSNPDTGQPYTVTIPFLGAQPVDGGAIVAADGGTATLTETTVGNPNFKMAASFTSGGPRNPDSAVKPDVMAPGVSVASAGMGTGARAAVMSGTSMACPQAAGIAALVKEAHPGWQGDQIKAAIMNTADPSKNISYNLRIAGAGVVQAQRAVNSTVLATTDDALDSIPFGYVAGSGDYTAHKSFTLTNYGSKDATYNLSVAINGLQRGSQVSVSPSTVTVPAPKSGGQGNDSGSSDQGGDKGKRVDVTVTLTIHAADFATLPSDDTFTIGPGGVTTVRGNVVAIPAAGHPSDQQTIRVPFIIVPRGLSNVAPGDPSKWTASGNTVSATLPLTNNGIHAGTADLYSWGIHKASDRDGSSIDVRDVGLQLQPGIASGDLGLVWAINTYGRAANQSVSEFDILIYVDNHTTPDFVVVGYDLGQVLGGSFNGVYGSFTLNAHTHKLIDAFYAEAPMNGSIVELPTLTSDLGLTAASAASITYRVAAFSIVPGGSADFTGFATFNPFNPAVSSGDFASIASRGSSHFTLTARTDEQGSALGWLVVSVDNANGAPQAHEVAAPENRGNRDKQQQN